MHIMNSHVNVNEYMKQHYSLKKNSVFKRYRNFDMFHSIIFNALNETHSYSIVVEKNLLQIIIEKCG